VQRDALHVVSGAPADRQLVRPVGREQPALYKGILPRHHRRPARKGEVHTLSLRPRVEARIRQYEDLGLLVASKPPERSAVSGSVLCIRCQRHTQRGTVWGTREHAVLLTLTTVMVTWGRQSLRDGTHKSKSPVTNPAGFPYQSWPSVYRRRTPAT